VLSLLLLLFPAEDLLARAATDPDVEQQLIKRMRGLLAPFVLRRLKSELAEQMVTKNHKLHEVCGEVQCVGLPHACLYRADSSASLAILLHAVQAV
jgi:hypothetical protein